MTEHKDRILWIYYEEYLEDPVKITSALAEFIGVHASEELIQQTIKASSFDMMKSQAGISSIICLL
jgi:hypothetical protein